MIKLVFLVIFLLFLRGLNPVKGIWLFYSEFPKTIKGQWGFLKFYFALLRLSRKSYNYKIIISEIDTNTPINPQKDSNGNK